MGRRAVSRRLLHLDASGAVNMVSVTGKEETRRRARARAVVNLKPETLRAIRTGSVAKGNVAATVRLAGIQAVKRTAELIPLCHSLALTHADIKLSFLKAAVTIECAVETVGRTGVEMEALVGVAVAALSLYDMCKSIDRWMTIKDIRLLEKSGGRSGTLVGKRAR